MENKYKGKSCYSIQDFQSIGDTIVILSVDVQEDLTTNVTSDKFKNSGYIKIESMFIEPKKDDCFWDNLSFFLNASKEEIKEECLSELKEKGLYEEGIFDLIQEILNPFVEKGYLHVNPGEDY